MFTQNEKRFISTRRQPRSIPLLRVVSTMLFAMSFAGIANAQGTMDFSGATTLMATFRTFAMYAGAVICLGGLIFAGIRMMSGRVEVSLLIGALVWRCCWRSFNIWLAAHAARKVHLKVGDLEIEAHSVGEIEKLLQQVGVMKAEEEGRKLLNSSECCHPVGRELRNRVSTF